MKRISPGTVLAASAVVFALIGIAVLFLARETAQLLEMGSSAALALQFASAGLLAMATLNWFGRSAVYGGIYGRPIMLANFTFGAVFGGSVAGAALSGVVGWWGWALTALFVAYLVATWSIMQSAPRLPAGPNNVGSAET